MMKIRTIQHKCSEQGHKHWEQGRLHFNSGCTGTRRAFWACPTEVNRQTRDYHPASFYLLILSPSSTPVSYRVMCKWHSAPSAWLEPRPSHQMPASVKVRRQWIEPGALQALHQPLVMPVLKAPTLLLLIRVLAKASLRGAGAPDHPCPASAAG